MSGCDSVSVVVPTYNRRHLLALSIESILSQTVPISEVIVVDDGSSDGTAEAVACIMKDDPRWREKVRFVYQENQGQSSANNAGIAMATGMWLAFNASDDIWLPNKLELQFQSLAKAGEEYGVCFSDAWFMNNPYMKDTVFTAAGVPLGQMFGRVRDAIRLIGAGKHPVWMQTALIRADLVRAVSGVDRTLRYSEDHDFMFRLSLHTKFCFVSIPLVLIDRSPVDTRHGGVATNWHKEEFCLEMDQKRLEKQLILCERQPVEIQDLARRQLGSLHQAWANLHIHRGRFAEARQSIDAAAQYGLGLKLLVKWLAVRLLPSLLRRAVERDKANEVRYDRASWMVDQTIGIL
jgi:glycosyltransferase involved in cell wall biosynthesis